MTSSDTKSSDNSRGGLGANATPGAKTGAAKVGAGAKASPKPESTVKASTAAAAAASATKPVAAARAAIGKTAAGAARVAGAASAAAQGRARPGAGAGEGRARPRLGLKRDVEPVTASVPAAAPRRVRLVVSRLDPWSVMKMSFLLSVALGIITVVSISIIWLVLNSMGVFGGINDLLTNLGSSESSSGSGVRDAISFGRIVSGATIVAVVNVVLLTAVATLGAVIYNIAAALVGGYLVTLTDD